MSVWETDGKRSYDALSREISRRNAACTIRGGDFSTPLRCGRNDGGGVISSGGTHRYGWQKSEPFEPYEPGPRSGPSSRPLPSRCARHPPPGRGWAGNMEEKNVASNRHIPFCGGKRVPRPSNLPPTARRGEGDHEMVEGAAEGGIIKNCGEAATITLGPKGRQT